MAIQHVHYFIQKISILFTKLYYNASDIITTLTLSGYITYKIFKDATLYNQYFTDGFNYICIQVMYHAHFFQ